MEKVNYIAHLNAVFERFNNDERIKQGHITLYLAFFQKWNREFFKKTLTINRQFIMEKAKFRSKTTYHNYLRDLNDWGYLNYFPSFHPARGSKVNMSIFGTTSGTSSGTPAYQKMANSVPEPGHNLIPSYKHKTKENLNKLARPKNGRAVLIFFRENNWQETEGRKFYAYYESKNWKLRGGLNIKNWKAQAKKFVEKGIESKQELTTPISGYLSNMRKNYNEPL
ncbi:hypothetical protein [Maribacter sp.]|nr:hypothetical protein [Maribacter sp.]HDZ07443.1 hypothetical protein [Maribacter sp.]HEA79864.1 hypothetical protein [Maribacter sp.]|tara:strand:- start:19325 stop:19996 length:672 start_codon:yes stop_codon:yes gene_type:complete